jgi:hypothetical protein
VATVFGTRAGYILRPMDGEGRPVLWRENGAGTEAPPVDAGTTVKEWRPYPKQAKMKMRAMAADIFSTPHRIAWRHIKGINVAYSDGSAKWFDHKKSFREPARDVRQGARFGECAMVDDTSPCGRSSTGLHRRGHCRRQCDDGVSLGNPRSRGRRSAEFAI